MRRFTHTDDFSALHALLRRAFAGMEGRIDPPSSLTRMSADDLRQKLDRSEIWGISTADQPVACLIMTPRDDHLYLGKLAVDPAHQGKGLARQLLIQAEQRAGQLHLSALQLQTRVELTENHRFFRHLGFQCIAQTCHKGYDRPTSLTFRKPL